jgi:hypothetical protein
MDKAGRASVTRFPERRADAGRFQLAFGGKIARFGIFRSTTGELSMAGLGGIFFVVSPIPVRNRMLTRE